MAERIVLDTGLKTYEIEFKDRDEIAEISFNPTDKDLAVRFKNAQSRIDARMKEFSERDIELDEDGTPKDLQAIDDFEKITRIICEEIDTAFNSKVSETVFKYCNPLACVNGDYFFMTFFDTISKIIEKENAKETKKANSKMDAYLKKYRKYIKK